MTFDQAIKIILGYEGGYVFDSNDPGGETNFGLSKRAYPNLDIKSLSEDAAKAIYKNDFWDDLRLDEMPDQIRLTVFDCAVNQGKSRAIKFLQGACGISQDGIIGPLTFQAIHEIPVGQVLSDFSKARFLSYSQNPRWNDFGKGWAKRLIEVILESVEVI